MRVSCNAVLLGALLAMPALRAQISVEVRTLSPMRARANSSEQTIPANTVLTTGQGVQSRAGGGSCSADAKATATFAAGLANADVTLFHEAFASADSGSRCFPQFAEAGRNDILVSLCAPVAVLGQLLVTVDGLAVGSWYGVAGSIYQEVDIGNDGVVEMMNTYTGTPLQLWLELPVTLGPQPLRIRLAARTAASAYNFVQLRASLSQQVHFVGDPGATTRIREVGQPCGAQLGGMLLRDLGFAVLDLRIRQAPSTTWSFLVFGTQAVRLPIAPTGCVLLQDIAVTLPVVLQFNAADVRIDLPLPFPSGEVRLQFLAGVVQGADVLWYMSQGLHIAL